MALSLDDRLLGEKVHNYCSSSEDEGGNADSGDEAGADTRCGKSAAASSRPQIVTSKEQLTTQPQASDQPRQWRGAAANTGPKGVVQDWRRFKQLEAEARAGAEAERAALASRLALSCRTAAEDEREAELDAELEAAMSELDESAFLAEYRRRRLEEVRQALAQRKLFGRVTQLCRADFVQAVDGEPADAKVVVHIFDSSGREPAACGAAINAGLDWLAGRYPTVKFCRIPAGEALVSRKFVERGLPALVVYKAGEVTDSFVALGKELGEDCAAEELESFLTEYGVLSEALLLEGQTVSQLAPASAQEAGAAGSGKIRGPATGAAAAAASSDSDDCD